MKYRPNLTAEQIRENIGLQILKDQMGNPGNERITYDEFRSLLCARVNAINPTGRRGINPDISVPQQPQLSKQVLTPIGDQFVKESETDVRIDVLVVGKHTGIPGPGFWRIVDKPRMSDAEKELFVANEICRLRDYFNS